MSPTPADSFESGWQWKERLAFGGVLATGVVVAGAVAYAAPVLFWLVPLALLAVLGALARWEGPVRLSPLAPLGIALVLAGIALKRSEGFRPEEVIFAAYCLPFLIGWYGLRVLVYREPIVRSKVDFAMVVLIVVVNVQTLNGIFLGSDLGLVQSDWRSLSMLGFYFPIKEVCSRYDNGYKIIFYSIIFMAFIALVRNVLITRTILDSAVYAWQVARVRVTSNEIGMTIGAVLCAAYAADAKRRLPLLLASAGFGAFTVGVVLTQWRAYYVSLAFGLLLLTVLADGTGRRRIMRLVLVGAVLGASLLYLILGDGLTLLALGVLDRLLSIGTATQVDISLINRFLETEAIWGRIKVNPVLGYGLGNEFSFFDLVTRKTWTKPFAHNGFVSLWFKLGLVGLVSFLWTWGGSIHAGVALVRQGDDLPPVARTLGRASVCMLVALIPSFLTSAPFTTGDTTLCFVLLMGTVTGLAERTRAAPVP